ncbi:sterol desaturase family protein [Polaromonas glacialis]|uniref:sterol desaturase family protein n=1 Tax=Polaromonas glacialis TaxID=866564 RepID=UPI000495C7B2|nr:sterol desaturase family protein [Polaromonas glacialis]
MDWLTGIFAGVQGWLFQAVVQPALFALDLASLFEDGYAATAWFMVGVLQVIVLVAVIGPLQRWRPVEAMDSPADRASIRIDVLYTLIHRLGLFRLALFFTLDPWFDAAFGALRTAGYGTFHLDQLWPGVTDMAVVSLLIYLLVFDFVAYWTHRGQHQLEWWWRLHSLHHSQRRMTMWSDNRNHLLDSILIDGVIVVVAQLIGVASDQFILIVALTQLSESFQHANVRLWFGRVGERLWVSPRFHRLHHSIGLNPVQEPSSSSPAGAAEPASPGRRRSAPPGGSEPHEVGSVGAFNFGVLLPWWDMLFGTANFELRYDPTGVRDQVEKHRDYGSGFWSQQWLGLKRLFGRA